MTNPKMLIFQKSWIHYTGTEHYKGVDLQKYGKPEELKGLNFFKGRGKRGTEDLILMYKMLILLRSDKNKPIQMH